MAKQQKRYNRRIQTGGRPVGDLRTTVQSPNSPATSESAKGSCYRCGLISSAPPSPGEPAKLTPDERSELQRLRRENQRPAAGARHPKKSDRYLLGGTAMRYQFIREHATQFPICQFCARLAGDAQWLLRLADPSGERAGPKKTHASLSR